jgi:hypothetical protein
MLDIVTNRQSIPSDRDARSHDFFLNTMQLESLNTRSQNRVLPLFTDSFENSFALIAM